MEIRIGADFVSLMSSNRYALLKHTLLWNLTSLKSTSFTLRPIEFCNYIPTD